MLHELSTKICTKCEIEKPVSEFFRNKQHKSGFRSHCKDCVRKYYEKDKEKIKKRAKEYAKNNKERVIEQRREYYIKNKKDIAWKGKEYRKINKVTILQRKKEYYYQNRNEINNYQHEWYEKNKNLQLIKVKKYRNENKEKISKNKKRYYKQNKERISDYRKSEKGKNINVKNLQKRRANKLKATVEDFNPSEVFKRDNYICQLCGCKTRPDFKNQYHPKYPNLDHIIPLTKGGEHSRRNTQCLCHQCNMEKHNTGTGDQLRLFG